jgi:hypothetical protein
VVSPFRLLESRICKLGKLLSRVIAAFTVDLQHLSL